MSFHSRLGLAETAADAFGRFRPDVMEAWQDSFLSEFDEGIVAELLSDASEVEIGTGEIFYNGAHHADMAIMALVLDGLLRTVIGGPDGREITIRYAAYGAVVGLPAVIIGGSLPRGDLTVDQWLQVGGASITGEALRKSRILRLPPSRFRRLAGTRADVAWPLARYMAQQTVAIEQLLAAGVFRPVRARVARHVLDLAELEDRAFVVRASHQEIANATGTVREVVSRVLRAMVREGLVERRGAVLVLLDSDKLHEISGGA